jgi:alkylation response protein AidB-like acyl-CoA dehydrogenase
MDLKFTPEEEAFRVRVHTFLTNHLPERLSRKVKGGKRLKKVDMQEWHAILNRQGWLASHWPVEHGGPGWTVVERFIFENESALAGAPRIVPFGVSMLAPVLIKYGSESQKRHWLPRILDGSDWWCQGYSEPGAGSDLASVKTTAVRDGDHYIVNGQKTWTTLGQHANMIFCLVRTSKEASKQAGISFLLVDMTTPGVEVRPIITFDGEHEVNEVFLNDVRVPVGNLVGEENKGWTYAKYLLTYERTNIAGIGPTVALLEKVREAARARYRNERPLLCDPSFAGRLARAEIDLANLQTTNLRVLAAVAGGGVPGAESSMLKIRGTELRQELSSLLRRAMGPYAIPYAAEALEDEDATGVGPAAALAASTQYFNNRKLSIYGGSNEVQRNIIAKSILGL